MDINEDILNGIWYELMTMNAMKAMGLINNPSLSPAERGFVAGIVRSVVEPDGPLSEEGEDEGLGE